MHVYGIWSLGHKEWCKAGFELGIGLFTQHRGFALAVLASWKDGIEPNEWEEWRLEVCTLGDDGLPMAKGKGD